MRIAVVGAGFWATYQIAGWHEIPGVEIVGVADPSPERAARFGVPAYPDLDALLDAQTPDLVDVLTPVETHAPLVRAVAARGLPVVCQKPMGTTFEEARGMVEACERADVPFFVNENWRFQAPLRRVEALLDEGAVGRPFRARLQFSCSFPVFDNQPFLRTLDRFILTDIGSHVLDAARLLFGEASSLFCLTSRVTPGIAGEDVATVLMRMSGCEAVACEMSYASRLADEAFPQTYAVIEGSEGSVELRKDYRILSPRGEETVAIPAYPWADPAYALVHASIVECQRAILDDLQHGLPSGLRGRENLRTVELVFASYASAAREESVRLRSPD
ncbi:Gfo/Idh/MocA family oxidoreductase [soil metagenome]